MATGSSKEGKRPPGTLTLEVTRRCRRSCAYCYNACDAGAGGPYDELPAEELLPLVSKALEGSGMGSVQISGGEPLLRKDIFEIVAGIRSFGAGVSIATDGELIDNEVAARLARHGVRPVQPTLLSATRELHNQIKGADCFDATVAAIARLRRNQVPVSVAFVCTRRNYAEIQGVIELCFALGVEVVAFNRLCVAGSAAHNDKDLMPTPAMVASCLDAAEWANDRLGMKVSIAISLPLCVADTSRYPHLKLGRCSLQSATPGFTIDPLGNVRACAVSSTNLGNLADEPWEVIMARAREGYFKEMAAVPEACTSCVDLARCAGGCRESALACYGDLARPDPLASPVKA